MRKLNAAFLWAAAALLVTVACGGGSSSGGTTPTAPPPSTTPTIPVPPPAPTNTWSVAGTVVETVSRQAISGATVTPSWSLGAVSAGGSGDYGLGAVANPPTTPYKLTTSADGFVTRELWVNWQAGARTSVTLDLIRHAAPFSMEFYRQIVRGSFGRTDGPWPVLRWTEAPSFYVKTVDQNGRPVEPEVMIVVLDALRRAVPVYTGGVYSAKAIETGSTARPEAVGWISVDIIRDPTERNTCGTAYIGRNPGEITLYNDVCSCGSVKIPGALVMHEVGHALGFFHVSDNKSVMYPFIPGNCPPGDASAAERVHAAIAYQRPRGNTDPDNDPSSGGLLAPSGGDGPATRVKN